MTVKELREALAALPDDYRVVLATPRGDAHLPLQDAPEGLTTGVWEPVVYWCGRYPHGHPQGLPEDAVCLWPETGSTSKPQTWRVPG